MGTFLLLVVLAGWMAVGLWWLTSHRDTPTDAIGSFRRQLGSLERRSPALVAPAHRLHNRGRSQAGVGVGDRVAVPPAYRRAAIQKRRRDILSGLALATGGSLMLGFVPALRPMWLITLVSGAMLAGYVYLLVQLRNVRAEREMRNRFATGPAVMQPVAPIYELDLRDAQVSEDSEFFGAHYADEHVEYDEEGRVLEPALARSAANW